MCLPLQAFGVVEIDQLQRVVHATGDADAVQLLMGNGLYATPDGLCVPEAEVPAIVPVRMCSHV